MKPVRPQVLASVNSADDLLCVDLFKRMDGSYGFELFRRDPEDPRGWSPAGGFGNLPFATVERARAEAVRCIPWLKSI